jgi:hypothetical protein
MLDTVTVRNSGSALRRPSSVTSARPLKGGAAVLRYASTPGFARPLPLQGVPLLAAAEGRR